MTLRTCIWRKVVAWQTGKTIWSWTTCCTTIKGTRTAIALIVCMKIVARGTFMAIRRIYTYRTSRKINRGDDTGRSWWWRCSTTTWGCLEYMNLIIISTNCKSTPIIHEITCPNLSRTEGEGFCERISWWFVYSDFIVLSSTHIKLTWFCPCGLMNNWTCINKMAGTGTPVALTIVASHHKLIGTCLEIKSERLASSPWTIAWLKWVGRVIYSNSPWA